MDIERVFEAVPLLDQAFKECRVCLNDVYARAQEVIVSPVGTPPEFEVSCGGIPPGMLSLRRNLFSSFFQATYGLLAVPEERRFLYGKINYLFRIWVTSADNLLDDEDKLVMDLRMGGESHVMRQVVSIMAADRILQGILDDAVWRKTITAAGARYMLNATLQVLLPSAAEEASEEAGVDRSLAPEYVLSTIHRIKTGILFLLPLLGPEHMEQHVDRRRLALCREGLGDFGIGCQLLDDVRDIARDHFEHRHNYVISVMARASGQEFSRLNMLPEMNVAKKVFRQFPDAGAVTVELAERYLRQGLIKMDACGLGLGQQGIDAVTGFMFKALDVEEALSWARN
ncbi:MAG: hypothetical protein HQL19_05530 [Candidatus Omnitrophica bacterium]|nr:hypothetical protein [Candidatus Omnitrophota bacterium]